MRVRVEVVNNTLDLRGPIYHAGERLYLDDADPQHRQAIDQGWVRRLPLVDPVPAPAQTTAVQSAPVDRMVRAETKPAAAHGSAARTKERKL